MNCSVCNAECPVHKYWILQGEERIGLPDPLGLPTYFVADGGPAKPKNITKVFCSASHSLEWYEKNGRKR